MNAQSGNEQTSTGQGSFTILYLVFGAAGGLHPQDVAKLYLGDDPLGVLSRLNFVYTKPTFKRSREVVAAASVVAPVVFGLETSLSDVFLRVHKAVSVNFCCSHRPVTFF